MSLWPDGVCTCPAPEWGVDGSVCYLYGPTSQSGREFMWDMLDTGYVKYGVKNFWFDASEPESIARFHSADADVDYDNPLGPLRFFFCFFFPLWLDVQCGYKPAVNKIK